MRLYFATSEPAPVAPIFSGMWMATTEATRKVLRVNKSQEGILVGSTINGGAAGGSTYLDRQYISPGLVGRQIIQGRITGQLMVREFATTDNVNRCLMNIRLVSNNGLIERGTLLPSGNYGPTLEFVNNATCRNKTLITDSLLIPRTGQDGDRIVVEIGYQNSTAGTTPQAAAKWGTNAPDLPVNETQTTNGAGWLALTDLRFRNTEIIVLDSDD